MKKTLLATTAAVGIMFASGPALAFDDLHWEWNKIIEENVNINVDIDSVLLPDGHVEIQKIQTFEGDVRAEVNFSGDYLSNDSTEFEFNFDDINLDQDHAVSGSWTLEGNYYVPVEGGGSEPFNTQVSNMNFPGFTGDITVDEDNSYVEVSPNEFYFEMEMEGVFAVNGLDLDLDDLIEQQQVTLDAATEMGTLVGDAVAIANYQSLQTETATFLHDVQEHLASNETGFGVEALANAGDFENPVEAGVDLSATAISNYMNLEGSPVGQDNILIADITQSTNANVQALATATQDLSGFNNLGGYTGIDPDMAGVVGRLNATAIGNYASLSFGPSIDLNLGE